MSETTMVEATPRPWSWDGQDIWAGRYYGDLFVMEPEVECRTCGTVRLNISDANRAFLIRAVNAYDALVSALEQIHEWADAHSDGAPDASPRDRDAAMIYAITSEALALAREGA